MRLDGDPDPKTGKRRQVWTTHDTLTDARAQVNKHKDERKRGVLIAPGRQTFREYAETWHQIRSRRVREVTANAYRSCLNRAYGAFGSTQLSRVSRADVEKVIASLADAGRRKRTASLTLFSSEVCSRMRCTMD